MADETIWAVHAGRTDEGDDLFRKQNRIALGWEQLEDLSKLAPTRDAFKEALVAASPDYKPGAIPNIAGQLYRFVYEMKNGDTILYPTRFDSQIHIGRVIGDYLYDPDTDAGFPHQRPVKWIRSVPRSTFSQDARYELGALQTP